MPLRLAPCYRAASLPIGAMGACVRIPQKRIAPDTKVPGAMSINSHEDYLFSLLCLALYKK